MRPARQITNRSRGFSLLEALVSLGVVMVLSAVSLPMAGNTVATYRLRTDAHQLAAHCQNARFRAVSSNVAHRLHLSGRTIEVQRAAGGTFATVESYGLSPGITVFSSWSADPVFSPRGTVSSSATITLTNEKGLRRTIQVSILGVIREQ